MRLRIISDGTARGTELLTEEGQRIVGVESISWHAAVGAGKARATIVVRGLSVESDVEVYRTQPETE